jgi:hypothetical protein
VDLAAVFAAPQPALKSADRALEGGVEAVGARLAADHRTTAARRDLHVLTILALAAVAFVLELDVEEVDGAVKPLETGQLLRYVDAEVFGDLDVAALDHNLGARHCFGLLVGLRVCGGQELVRFHGSA